MKIETKGDLLSVKPAKVSTKALVCRYLETPGPIDRTPETPGSGKKGPEAKSLLAEPGKADESLCRWGRDPVMLMNL